MKTPFHALTVLLSALAAFVISACQTISDPTARGAGPLAARDVELTDAQLTGRVDEAAGSMAFRLRAQVRATTAGARLRLLSGRVALGEQTSGDGWHVEIAAPASPTGQPAFDLICERRGPLTLDLVFLAGLQTAATDWRALDFAIAAGAIVPLTIEGLDGNVSFKTDAPVVPVATDTGWRGFLPGDGVVSLAWRHAREAAEGALFFTSTELAEARVGAGLLQQASQVSLRVMQGKLGSVRCRLDGPGEITGVEGTGVVAWKVLPAAGEAPRLLEVRFSRPVETEVVLVIRSQTELSNWPVRAEPLRLTPEGGVRHSGFVRVANSGAVRLEVAEAAGLMQLAPAQWPGAAVEAGARQVFVYRFPAASYGYRVLATQIQPEIGVSVIATYELGETARILHAALELDVREAPLRDWTLRIPADHTVVALTGNDVADYAVESDATEGTRALRILFTRPIDGRQLLQLRLEKNQPAAAGDWSLPALLFPGAKSVRGHLGAVATPGFRLVPARTDNLAEVPLAFFPRQTAGLQQAWRLRDADWTAELRVEALGQSVQADVFHLYALKEGAVSASVLLNYFVVGAPASEWRITVPPGVGNFDVTGQNVRRDWRREGDTLIVSLHQPVLGAATLLVTFEQSMSARDGTLQPGLVRPLGVQSERGYVQVVSPLQVKHEIARTEGALLKLEPTELPAEFRLLTSAPSVAVYHYTARPFALELKLDWFAPGETVEQVVEFAKLASQVSRDGQVVTEAKFFVKTRGQKALRIVLPAGAKLWEARVDQELVNVRLDGEHLLIPLPARPNPNEPVAVTLRVGHAAPTGDMLRLTIPRTAGAATVVSEWTVRGEAGRQLVPRGGNAELAAPALTEDGFEWIAQRGPLGTFVVLALTGLTALLLRAGRTGEKWLTPAGLLVSAAVVAATAVMALAALTERRANLTELSFSATLVPAADTVTVELANLPPWRAMTVGWGAALAVAGAVLLAVAAFRSRDRERVDSVLRFAGTLGLALGLLAQHGGAALFFVLLGATVLLRMLVPAVQHWRRERRDDLSAEFPPRSAGGAATLSLLALLGVTGASLTSPDLHAATPVPSIAVVTKPAQSLVQHWTIKKDRLFGELTLTVRGVPGDTLILLRPPAVLTEFKGDHLRLAPIDETGRTTYRIVLEREGTFTARAKFELPVGDRSSGIALPTGLSLTQRLTLDFDQGGWEFSSPSAVQVVATAGLADDHSGATLTLAPHEAPTILFSPRQRDLTAETTVYFAEIAHLYAPGPGAVNGVARVAVRPVQGRVTSLSFDVPAGLTIGDVRGPVGAWRFDPEKRRLHVTVEPAQAAAFAFNIEMQFGAGALPYSLTLEPLRAVGAAGDSGMIALAFGGDAQPESVRAVDLTTVNAQDFNAAALARPADGSAPATVQHAWRYGATGGRVELKVAPVAPEVRVTGKQVFSLDDDRLVLAADLRVAILRVGLFKLSFPLPEGLEVEAISGTSLSHWTEANDQGRRIVTLHLNGRTLGEQTFSVSLAGAAPRPQEAWPLPRLLVREATRQTGEALIVPGKGLRVRASTREKVTQLDPRSVGGMQPGTLAFRLLQEDWVLQLGLEALAPWVTVQALQEVTLREGQTLTRLALRYRVENAAIKTARVKLPGLGGEHAGTVRATGPAVNEIVRVTGTPDEWEVRFQRAIAGDTDVLIEFQGSAAREAGRELVAPVEFVGARSAAQFVAVRSGGRLELEAVSPPRGWSRSDWSAVPAVLQSRSDRSVPALNFRVVEPEGPLAITARRHDVADALKLRVTQGDLLTLLSDDGHSLTSVDLKVEVLEKSALRVRLPGGAQLFNTVVNGERVAVVREGDAWLFYVFPSSNPAERTASVRLVYTARADAKHPRLALTGPGLSVPLENVTWRVVLPPGRNLAGYEGALQLRESAQPGGLSSFSVEDYTSFVKSRRASESRQAMSLLSQASVWAAAGEQEKAAATLRNVSNGHGLDAASNEDARVQLRNLNAAQAVVGLNTRRQRLYLDNGALVATRNDQLEQAASKNPFMQGKANFKPQEVDQLLLGNTSEENAGLRAIAARIVDQQLAAEPAPSTIDVNLPERGHVVTFTRSLQVDGGAPLELNLALEQTTRTSLPAAIVLLLALAGLAAVELSRRSPRRA